MNNNGFDKKMLEGLLSQSSKIDSKKVNEAVKTGDASGLVNSLSSSDKEKLSKVLNDKQALESMLKSPQAMALLKLFGGGKKNG